MSQPTPKKNRTSSMTNTQQWYDLYGDSYEQPGCHASNDPPTTSTEDDLRGDDRRILLLAKLQTCNITKYMCPLVADKNHSGSSYNRNNSNNTMKAIEVFYEYELYFNPAGDLTGTLIPYLEESMLENLAAALGIKQCRRRQNTQKRQRMQQSISSSMNATSGTVSSQFVGVNLRPHDSANKKYTTCQQKSSNGSMLQYGGDETECIPMMGGVTVYVQLTNEDKHSQNILSKDDRLTIRDTVSNFIHDAMTKDVFVVPTNIEKVVFVGNSSNPMVTPTTVVTTSTGNAINESSSSTTIGWIYGLAGVFLLFIILLLCCCYGCHRRRRRTGRSAPVDGARSIQNIDDSTQNEEHDAEWGNSTGGPRCLASLDSLALRGRNVNESVLKNNASDSESACNTSRTSTVESNSMNREDPKDNPLDVIAIDSSSNDDQSEELVGQKVVELMEDDDDVESIVAAMSDELDLLDRLALQGRPPPYPAPSSISRHRSDELLVVTPSRSLSPTTISAASQTTLYNGSRNIVGSPTTCSQSTMPAGNLKYHKNHPKVPSSAMAGVLPGSIRTAYIPDSFDEEILGVISDDSHDNIMYTTSHNEHYETPPPPQQQEQQQQEQEQQQQEQQQHTFPDVLNGHGSYINDDDVLSFRSDHENNNAVRRHLQMS
jgi:hypothetical protein